ncbi:hypothetical protein LTR96_003657 [Exophiala xenobiotica]|nr:hypothetical protein LTR96_003657 [Exophiala xenobiotica]KAK5343064.1 hypothetical protein LTR98_000693 [Exophiala xenobiotica]KAK5534856.1 hypothetical protein LTR23_008652 [Chaetothyriales sp. CCFEE 6169]
MTRSHPPTADTNEHVNGGGVVPNGHIAPYRASPLAKITSSAFAARHLRILMIGAGISGIQLAHDVTTTMNNYELEIYDKNSGLGGTWFENKYPGCACDVPAHTYMFAWEPNYHWSKFYAPSSEICEYLNRVVDKHDLRKYMRFNHRAINAEWHEESSTWRVELEATDENGRLRTLIRECGILVQGVGALNAWKYPDIAGILDFKGALMHTATWDDSVDLSGKSVAVIGNGASAVQCVAALQPVVGKLHNYMRTASWMLPHLFSEDGSVQKEYPVELRTRFENDPEFYYEYVVKLERNLAGGFEALWTGSDAQKALEHITTEHMKKTIKDPKILATLMPKFEIGCRRFTPGDHYLQALEQDNVQMISDAIVRITEHGITDDTGVNREVDVIVCATGFETSFEPRFPVIGRGGYSLAQNWGKEKPCESYMGAVVARFPNFFVFNPPICPVIGSAFPGIQATSQYIMRMVDRLQHDCLKSIVVKESAQVEFNQWAQQRMQEMAFTGNCKSWYKDANGKVFIPWPGTILHYIHATSLVRWEDFDFVFENPHQKYASLGNGVPPEGFAPESPPWLRKPRSTMDSNGSGNGHGT